MGVAANILIDGATASPDDLAHVALVNYGAFTSFRVEAGGVRGLDLHLARLEASARELFGETVGEVRLRELMWGAAQERGDCWMRVQLFASEISTRTPEWTGTLRVMIAVTPPPSRLPDGLRLQSQVYGREAPHLKHVATFGLIRARRTARAAGFGDALFVDAAGRISEGSLWNIGFVRGREIVWPQAPMLAGVGQTVLERGLADAGLTSVTEPVRLTDLAGFDAAFICNSATPAAAVTSIDGHVFGPPPMEALHSAWALQPLQPI